MFKTSRRFISHAVIAVIMTASVPAFAQSKAPDPFLEVQQLFEARQYKEAKELLTSMNVRGDQAVEKYLWLSKVQLELGAGIAAETAIDRARELTADYASTAVPYAKALLVQGKYRAALKAMSGVNIPANMQDQAYIVSGDANFALRDYDKSRRDYNLAIAANDRNFQPYLGLSRLALQGSDLKSAEKFAKIAEERAPDNTMVQYTLGLISRYMGDLKTAEAHFLTSVRLFPENLMANIELASLRINQNRIEEAEQYLDTVFAASANQPMAIYLSAVILATKGEYDEAELLLQRVRSLTENYLPAVYVRGLVAYQLGKNKVAVEALTKVLQVRPQSKPARMALAGAYTNLKRPKAALSVLDPLLKSETLVDTAVLSMAAAAAVSSGDLKRGEQLYQRISDMRDSGAAPSVSGVTSKLAMAQFVTGDTQAAITTISNAAAGIGTQIRELGVMASMQIRNKDLKGAEATISKILETAPNRALGYNMQGTLAFRTGDYQAAVSSFDQALDRNPEYYSALRNRGLSYFRLGAYDKAEDDLKQLLKQQPNDARSKAVLAKTLLTVGKADEAVAYFKDALRSIPNSLILSADYSQALAAAGNTMRAIEQARFTAKKAADRPEILRQMGILLLDLDQPRAAERPLSRHVAFFPNSGEAHLLHGRSLLKMGLYTGAKISFLRAKDAREDKPDTGLIAWYLFASDALAHKERKAMEQLAALDVHKRPADISAAIVGEMLLHSGLPKEAEASFRAAIKNEVNSDLVIGLAEALSAQDQDQEAIQLLQEYLQEQPEDRFVRADLGARLIKAKNFEAAAEQYRAILRNGVADAKTTARLASVYLRLKNNKSIKLVEQAYLMSPDEPYILDTYGWIMLQAGRDTEKAIKALEKAVRRSPGSALYKYHLGMAYLAQNRTVDARRVLSQALNLDPSFEGAEEAARQIRLLESYQK